MKRALKSALTMFATLSLLAILCTPSQLAAQARPAATHYYVSDLGTLPGGNFSQPLEINRSGVIAGSSNLSNNDQHATVWSKGQINDLGTLGGSNSIANGLNNAGLAVGQAETSASDPNGEDFCGFGTHLTCQAFAWQNNVMTPLPTLGGNNGVANRTNRWGTAVGYAENTIVDPNCPAPQKFQFRPVVWKDGKPIPLRIGKGDTEGVAFTINNFGQVVGTSGTCTTLNPIWLFYLLPTHALLWENGKAVDLGNLGGKTGNMAVFINNVSQVVGLSDLAGDTTQHGFLWTKATGMQDLGTYPGDIDSAAISINDHGVIVGVSVIDTNGDSRAVVWNNGALNDLNTLVQPNPPLTLITACAINNRGEISGLGLTSTGEIHTYRAVPIQDDRNSVEGQ